MTVHKFPLSILHGINVVYLPERAKVLSCQFQHGDLQLWALVDRNAPVTLRKFYCQHTGDDFVLASNEEMAFVSTVQLDNGDYVIHVFEVKVV